ncbi:MAG: LysR family transcriptional regulator [Chloroflexota bacterium]
MLKLSKLEVFSVVTEEGSFSAAAERMHLSQPAVSRHMQELEDTLGIRLFRRGRRGVTLTPGGEILREYTQKILWMVGEAEGALTDVTQLAVGQVHIATTPGVSVYLAPGWTRAFTTAYPNLSVSMSTGTTSTVIENVMTGRVNLGVVEGELHDLQHERMGSIELQEIEQVLVVGRAHEWWHKSRISASDLHEHPFVSRQPNSRTRVFIDATLNVLDVYPHYVAEFDNPEAIKEAVMDGLGVTIFPDYTVSRERASGLLRAVPVKDLTLRRSLKLIWDRTRPFSPVTRAFLANLSETYAAIAPIVPEVAEEAFVDGS